MILSGPTGGSLPLTVTIPVEGRSFWDELLESESHDASDSKSSFSSVSAFAASAAEVLIIGFVKSITEGDALVVADVGAVDEGDGSVVGWEATSLSTGDTEPFAGVRLVSSCN